MSDAAKVHFPEDRGQTINQYRSQSASKSNGPYSCYSSSNFCPSICVHGCFSLSLSFSFCICSSVYLLAATSVSTLASALLSFWFFWFNCCRFPHSVSALAIHGQCNVKHSLIAPHNYMKPARVTEARNPTGELLPISSYAINWTGDAVTCPRPARLDGVGAKTDE